MTVLTRSFWQGLGLDRLAIGLSALCVVHCISTAVAIGLLATTAGEALGAPWIHKAGLILASGFGVIAMGRGIVTHGYAMPVAMGSLGIGVMAGAVDLPHGELEAVWTLVGVGLLALGHDLNRRAVS